MVDLLRSLGPVRARVGEGCDVLERDHDQVLLEPGGPARDSSVGSHHDRAAVEHELVLAADGVHVDDPRARLPSAIAEHVGPFVRLPHVERRAVDVRDEADAPVRVEGRTRQPRVLADGEPDVAATDRHPRARGPWDEVALLIEHAVVGKLVLRVAGGDRPVSKERGGVVQPGLGPVDEPDDHIAPGGGLLREPLQGRQVVLDEFGTQDQILGRIPGDRELREEHDVGTPVRGARRPVGHARHVPVEVTDGGVQLAECDPNHVRKRTGTAGPGSRRYSMPPMSTLYASHTRSAPR